ncbi:MAG TPA: ABC transporter permease [Candidatus Eisenbacteria bacterium]|nr:ABC transporter permease [Candidatus Eisenbacteria bacterium]
MASVAPRLLHVFLLLLAVSALSFRLLSAAPGNFFDELRLNPNISPETVAALKAEYGIDQPVPLRYLHWLSSIAHGDFGYSLSYRCPVGTLLWPRARNTLLLTGLSLLLAWIVAIPWGLFEAAKPESWFSRLGNSLTSTLLGIPELVLGLFLLLLAARTGWFPIGGMLSPNPASASLTWKLGEFARHLVLPVTALVLGSAPIFVRYVRSAVAEVLQAPFIDHLRGQGIPMSRLLYRHALPVAANSLISLFGFSLGALLSTSLLIEVVLGWPGLGPLVLEALLGRDIYLVMAIVVISSVFLVLGNLIADLLLYWSDPRIRTV